MTLEEALQVLDKMAAGLHPETNQPLPANDVCNTRSAIRALQMTIDHIKNQKKELLLTDTLAYDNVTNKTYPQSSSSLRPTTSAANNNQSDNASITNEHLTDERLLEHLNEFKMASFAPTVARLGKALVGTQAKSIYQYVKDFSFYGILQGRMTYNQIKPLIVAFFEKYDKHIDKYFFSNESPWETIDFFEQKTFNQLTENSIEHLKATINEFPPQQATTDASTETVSIARKIYPRAYAPWDQEENKLLLKMLRYTNDLSVLSQILKRGQGAIRSQGQKLLYQIAQNSSNGVQSGSRR